MHTASKNITEENFPVFKKLVEEIIVKATGKPLLKHPEISEIMSKGTGKMTKCMPEAKAREIINKITNQTVHKDNRGRRLQDLINAALNDNIAINARVHTLDSLAEYVLRSEDDQSAKDGKRNVLLDWKTYIEKHRHLLLQYPLNDTPIKQETCITLEVDNIPIVQPEGKQELHDFENKEPETPETINHHADFESSPTTSTSSLNKHTERKFVRAGIKGGIYSGIVASIIIALVRYINGKNVSVLSTGYESISFDKFMESIFTPLLFFKIVAGAFLGWFCCYTATKSQLVGRGFLFAISFIVTVVFRQSMARDAWYMPGTYLNHDVNGRVIMTGGLLGEPDFETIANGLMGALVISIIVQAFHRNNLENFTIRQTFKLIAKTTVYGIIPWCVVYGIYRLLTERLGVLHEGDYLIARWFFTVDFPHPERALFVIALYIVYVFCLIGSIQYYFHNKKEIAF